MVHTRRAEVAAESVDDDAGPFVLQACVAIDEDLALRRVVEDIENQICTGPG